MHRSRSRPGDVERNGVVLGLGTGYHDDDGLLSLLTCPGEVREGFEAHRVTGELRWAF